MALNKEEILKSIEDNYEVPLIENSFKNKVVIITGGTTGIGRGCVHGFMKYGANVVFCGRNIERGRAVETEMTERYSPNRCVFREVDVSDHEQVRELVEFTAKEFGRIDTLVNNAGYFPLQRPSDAITIEEFRNVLDNNLVAYFSGIKYSLPYLRATKGSVINIGSVLGITGDEGSAAYTATKGAIETMTRSIAADEGRYGVRINEIKPGHINTDMFRKTTSMQEDMEGFIKYSDTLQWLGRGGTSAEIACAVMFLASNWASYITGTDLLVSGGYEIGEGPKKKNPYLADWTDMMKVAELE
jgi:NAD(P)-dependent dehydrogenase (short-subunit alcohol dehydrogenase family)